MSFRRLERVPAWRTLALHAWRAPSDPTVYGSLELDARPALAKLDELRRASGERVTLTHLVGKAIAVAIAERPEVNAIVRRGRIYVRDTVDVFFQVAFEGGENLAGAKLERVNEKSVVELARELGARAARIRERQDDPTQLMTSRLTRLPPLAMRAAMKLGESLSYDLGLDLSRFGLPYDAFGSAMVTNVGGFGLSVGHAPLFPPSRVPVVLTVGAVREAPAVEGDRVVVRPTLTIGASFDHRLLDGFQAGKLARRLREVLEGPGPELR